jgi:pilus assembly protein CpaB
MDRSKRTALVVGIAVILAAVASLGMYRVVARMPARTAEVKTVDVVVAHHLLKLGDRITKDHIKVVKWPADTQIAGTFSKAEEVLDRGVITPMDANEPLTNSKLAPIEAGAGLPPSIPPGMRAVSVKVNEVVGVAGFVVPGTHVDVMVTLTGRQQQQESVTRVVVSNAQVLTAGTKYDQENAKEGKPIPTTVVTLLVTPEDGERIALAGAEGQIMLALRNPLDTATPSTTGVRTAGLLGHNAAPPAPAKPRASRPVSVAAKPIQPEVAQTAHKLYTVEAVRGGKRSEETVR